MAEPFVLCRKLQFQYRFDRLLPDKLQQAYQLLVPDHARPIGGSVTTFPQENMHDASRGHLRSGLFGSSEGGTHDCQSDRSLSGVGAEAQLRSAARMGVSRRRL